MKKRITAAALLLVGAQLTWAQGGPPTFDGIDTDGNGSISLEEVTAMFARVGGMGGQAPDPEQIFANWDSDGDGTLSRDEFDNRQRLGGGMGMGPGG
jgi:hypothetical protein